MQLGGDKTAEQVRSKRRNLSINMASDSSHEAEDEEDAPAPNLGPQAAQSSLPSPQIQSSDRIREVLESWGDREGGEEVRAIAAWIRDADQDPLLIESSASDIISKLGRRVEGARVARPPVRERNLGTDWERRLSRRKREFRECQYWYLRDQARLAARILDGAESQECAVPADQIYEAFREKWEVGEQFHGLGEFRTGTVADNGEFCTPILAKEVMENLNKMSNSSAPGPDRISKKGLLK
ncbi:uncharacterized protein LOC106512419, partial [Austrofundulus limnaeus]|uniref:Uncharacterized protein LOC106512419 n=1 Tax=Austrofundulus limnaeus TaxID=52670 RepID=A0A2I4AM05_AUSLI